jgi:hypothetical protein
VSRTIKPEQYWGHFCWLLAYCYDLMFAHTRIREFKSE